MQGWLLDRLNPRVPTQVRQFYDQDDEVEAGSGSEWIADGLYIGNNVAIRAPSNNEPFSLMMVQQATHTLLETFTNADGNVYVPGDVVFSRLWYERLQLGSRTYLLQNDKEPTSIYRHLVLASKFHLPPILYPVKIQFFGYELQLEVKKIIDEALRAALMLD